MQYRKELSVSVEMEGGDVVPALELIRAVRMLCGGIVGCRPRKYEITMSNEVAVGRLMDGFKIGETQIIVSPLRANEMMVSFLLPTSLYRG